MERRVGLSPLALSSARSCGDLALTYHAAFPSPGAQITPHECTVATQSASINAPGGRKARVFPHRGRPGTAYFCTAGAPPPRGPEIFALGRPAASEDAPSNQASTSVLYMQGGNSRSTPPCAPFGVMAGPHERASSDQAGGRGRELVQRAREEESHFRQGRGSLAAGSRRTGMCRGSVSGDMPGPLVSQPRQRARDVREPRQLAPPGPLVSTQTRKFAIRHLAPRT